MTILNWLKKMWVLIVIVLLATIICGPASKWIVAHIGPGFAQAALVIDGLASVALVLLFIDFMLDNRAQWGIFPTLDLNKAISVVINGDPEGRSNPVACAILVAAVLALVITILFLAIPRANELPVMQPQQAEQVQEQVG